MQPDPHPDKHRVRAAFDRAAGTYDRAAAVQQQVCAALLATWQAAAPGATPTRLLDAGCGTGLGARLLRARWPQAQLCGVDFAPAMVARARATLSEACVADIEALPWANAVFDAWWSSLTLQWCDLPRALLEAARVLCPGGQVVFSTLGSGTFVELREAFAQVDRHVHTLDFRAADHVPAALHAAGLQLDVLQRQRIVVHHADLKGLLREIKAVGANVVTSGVSGAAVPRAGLMSRGAWQALQAAYEPHRDAHGLSLSYDVLLVTAHKPG